MPLIVPVLRVFFTLLNVFETYKTLKMPPPSTRNGGHPTIRAMSQRKRAMKGCMTVWLVWCCLFIYERSFDGVVGLFIPFYHELKSLVILFFLLTRARGAEPIFLHVLRPFIKPYVSTLDAFFHVMQSFGDLLLLMAALPIEFCISHYRYWTKSPEEESVDDNIPEPQSHQNRERPANGLHRVDSTEYGTVRSRRHALDNAHAKASAAQDGVAPPSRSGSQPYEVWHPPQSPYEHDGLPTPPYEDAEFDALNTEIQADLDWRKYEPFPSAYPPTPLNPNAKLPPTNHEPMDGIEEEPGVVDEWRKYEPFPSAYPPTPLPRRKHLPSELTSTLSHIQEESVEHESPSEDDTTITQHTHRRPGFRRSLKPPYDHTNPDHAGNWSDDKENVPGVRHLAQTSTEGEGEMDIDNEYEADNDEDMEDEDSFNVTLQTPFPLSKQENLSHFSTASTDDGPDNSTGLSTVDNGSPFRTRANSEIPPTTSLVGTKRPYTGVDGEDLTARVRRLEAMRAAANARRVPTSQMRTPPRRSTRVRATGSTASNTVSEKEHDTSDAESSSSATKKRRIGSSSGVVSVRPKIGGKVEARAKPSVVKPAVSGTRVRRAPTVSRASSGIARSGTEAKSGIGKPPLPKPVVASQKKVADSVNSTTERKSRGSVRH
ncbi:unnamed protein product [Somion occarium]|uniref:Protein YOP1 n=1 Tax=Somion occarium TaxID=3059160 RepID=A0ABP1CX71_9APHY